VMASAFGDAGTSNAPHNATTIIAVFNLDSTGGSPHGDDTARNIGAASGRDLVITIPLVNSF
jgi:hypothetical protein